MIAKRLIAALCAVGLILGAWVVRDRVIEGDGSSTAAADGSGNDNVVVCASELRDVCRAVADDLGDDIAIPQIANAGDTLDDLSTTDGAAPMWITLAPFPRMVDEVRTARGLDPINHTEQPLASSPHAAVVRPDSTDTLVQACGNPVDLACLADQTQLSPTFAPLDTGIGTLGVAAAVAAHGDGVVDLSDVQFLVWARRLEAAGAHSLSGGTAIQTIQTRPTFPVAIGAEAEPRVHDETRSTCFTLIR